MEKRAQGTQTCEPQTETHAYLNRRLETEDETLICTKSTVLVDVVSSYVRYPERVSTISPTTREISTTSRAIDNGLNLDAIEIARVEEANSTIDHVYEEVGSFDETEQRYETLNYRENYSHEETNESLIDEFSLPSHKICSQCANSLRGSPVIYSDLLIHGKRKICAKEATLRHPEHSSSQLYFGYRSPSLTPIDRVFRDFFFETSDDYMPVSNLTKANVSGILYTRSVTKDVFDLEMSLGPCISLLESNVEKTGESNTQIYHRFAKSYYSRISEIGTRPPMIFPRVKSSRVFASVKSTGYDENTIYWMNYDKDLRKHRDTRDQRDEQQISLSINETRNNNNRSSLVLLEPLLLMPELASPRQNIAKNRITHSEHVKIVRMVIAYTLSFFLLAIITFYIVYFT